MVQRSVCDGREEEEHTSCVQYVHSEADVPTSAPETSTNLLQCDEADGALGAGDTVNLWNAVVCLLAAAPSGDSQESSPPRYRCGLKCCPPACGDLVMID